MSSKNPTTVDIRRAFHRLDRRGRRVWTVRRLAEKTGLSMGHVSQITSGRYRQNTKARRTILRVLGLKPESK